MIVHRQFVGKPDKRYARYMGKILTFVSFCPILTGTAYQCGPIGRRLTPLVAIASFIGLMYIGVRCTKE